MGGLGHRYSILSDTTAVRTGGHDYCGNTVCSLAAVGNRVDTLCGTQRVPAGLRTGGTPIQRNPHGDKRSHGCGSAFGDGGSAYGRYLSHRPMACQASHTCRLGDSSGCRHIDSAFACIQNVALGSKQLSSIHPQQNPVSGRRLPRLFPSVSPQSSKQRTN